MSTDKSCLAPEQISNAVYEEPSSLSEKKASRSREKAKQWTYYIETLNRTIDCIYEICHKEQTVNGCKEALMYLSNSVRDFESLIKTIQLEVGWDEKSKYVLFPTYISSTPILFTLNNLPTSMVCTNNVASMAKVAYCRQLLWKKHQLDLAEKMERRRRQDLQNAVSRSATAFKNRKVFLFYFRLSKFHSRSEPPLSELVLPDGIDIDDAWRAMTEEEESLVQEEESLKKEIEEFFFFSLIFAQFIGEMEEYASISWGEIVEQEITRYRKPGEFVERHEKLSSPSRKRNTENTTERHKERQRRAEELRQMLQKQKAERLKELSNKVEEVRRKRAELSERKLEHLQMRMAKAEENRQKNIEEKVKKARDDDVKVMEVQFINTIGADNMRHDVMIRSQEWEQRVQTIANERARKNEEKAAKEAAAEERRKIAANVIFLQM
uniref:Bm6285 n=1 Tax=Brugia malayi TaxID=6279 RepID=A0A0J9XRQ7_BRUMA|nr:Bm6285 [Brugia malayi]